MDRLVDRQNVQQIDNDRGIAAPIVAEQAAVTNKIKDPENSLHKKMRNRATDLLIMIFFRAAGFVH